MGVVTGNMGVVIANIGVVIRNMGVVIRKMGVVIGNMGVVMIHGCGNMKMVFNLSLFLTESQGQSEG